MRKRIAEIKMKEGNEVNVQVDDKTKTQIAAIEAYKVEKPDKYELKKVAIDATLEKLKNSL